MPFPQGLGIEGAKVSPLPTPSPAAWVAVPVDLHVININRHPDSLSTTRGKGYCPIPSPGQGDAIRIHRLQGTFSDTNPWSERTHCRVEEFTQTVPLCELECLNDLDERYIKLDFRSIDSQSLTQQLLYREYPNETALTTMPQGKWYFDGVVMHAVLTQGEVMNFNPAGFELINNGPDYQANDATVTAIVLPGLPYPACGPYTTGSDREYRFCSGLWNGEDFSNPNCCPHEAPGVLYLSFSVYDLQNKDELISEERFEQVRFDRLSEKELECAKKQLNKAKEEQQGNQPNLEVIDTLLGEVQKAIEMLPQRAQPSEA
ncbi:hypothetical protein NP233_g7542 [Leucocoprinus birnbaumii]|uniref:Uncharacterized protein n=1 Tax=Leucocoprinus birnbaumii TaxID=56174 RepID=A0AAD5VNZ1_9AGAR|nr:hypothetical protein NP233_g7542 [Leucocoprinus birnbaumii]